MVLMGYSEKAAIDKLEGRQDGEDRVLYSRVIDLDKKDFTGTVICVEVNNENEDDISLRFFLCRQTKSLTYASSFYLMNKEKERIFFLFNKEYGGDSHSQDNFIYDIFKEQERIYYSDITDEKTINLLRNFIYGESPKVKLVGKSTAIIPLTAKEIKAMKEVMEGYDELMLRKLLKDGNKAKSEVKERYY